MVVTPINHFQSWYNEELELSKVSIPAACCLSTIGADNYPNARIVSLKGIVEDNFVITGTVTSRKGEEIQLSNKVALTFWWTETERQVRVQGNAKLIDALLADKYFAERNRESQIVSVVSNQGQELRSIEELNKKYEDFNKLSANESVRRPENWSGYFITPIRVEFLEFRKSRFHNRKLYVLINGQWATTELQP